MYEEQQIDLKEIRPDMILSKDVVTENGYVLLAKDSVLNNINFSKLRSYGISSIYIKNHSIDESRPPMKHEVNTVERQKVPVESRVEFKEFVKSYDENKEEVRKVIHAISDGATVNLDELYRLTDGVMSKLKCKSDVFAFIGFIKDASEHTLTHSSNVALLSNLFASWLGLSEGETVKLTTAGILHDIGKVRTPPEILNKKGRLTDEEFQIMKRHPVDGFRILQNQDIPEEIKLAALLHHEKIDGTGYPLGVTGDKINYMAKMVTVVDIYDAMTANRVYRGKICPFEVIRTFERKVYGELDTEYLLVFLRNIAYSYVGTWVNLSDKRVAEVAFINQNNLSRPIVKIDDKTVIDLSYEKEITITSVV